MPGVLPVPKRYAGFCQRFLHKQLMRYQSICHPREKGGKERKKKQREEQTDALSGIIGRTKIWLKGKENCFFADDCAFKTSSDLSCQWTHVFQ